MRLYNLDPSALFYKYEAFVMSRPSGLRAKLSTMTLDTARELKKEIQREHQAKAIAASSHQSETPKSSGVGMRKGKGNMADLGGLYVSLKRHWEAKYPELTYLAWMVCRHLSVNLLEGCQPVSLLATTAGALLAAARHLVLRRRRMLRRRRT